MTSHRPGRSEPVGRAVRQREAPANGCQGADCEAERFWGEALRHRQKVEGFAWMRQQDSCEVNLVKSFMKMNNTFLIK